MNDGARTSAVPIGKLVLGVVFYDDDVYVEGPDRRRKRRASRVPRLEHIERVFRKYVRGHMFVALGSPVEQVVRFERDVLEVSRFLAGKVEIPHER